MYSRLAFQYPNYDWDIKNSSFVSVHPKKKDFFSMFLRDREMLGGVLGTKPGFCGM